MPPYYKRDNTGTTNWNLASSWSTVSSTSATNAGTFPSSVTADPVIFDANSSNVTINVASVCTSVSCTLYTGQITFTNSLSVRGSVTFSAGMTTTGTGNLIITGTSTLTSNSVQLSGGLQFTPFTFGLTGTIADNWTIVGSLTRTGANGYTIAGSGGVRTITTQGSFTGTLTINNITIRMTGTGNLSGGATSTGGGSIEIDTAGIISHNGTFSLNGIVFTYINGAFNSTATLACGGNIVTFNNWGNISRAFFAFDWNVNLGGQSVTLNSDIYITTNLTFTGNSGGNFNGAGRTVFIYGNISGAGNGLGGTATIQMEGSTNASITIGSIQNNLSINKSGTPTPATVSLLSSFSWGAVGRTLTRTSGNINPGASTITIPAASVTINDFTFWNLTVSTGGTIIQNVLNTINNNLTLNGTATFQGTAGWVCGNLISTAAGTFTVTLQQLITYRTRLQAFITGGTSGARTTMTSSGASNAIWTLDSGASQSMIYVNGTRIDSSQGQTIWSFGVSPANIATTINWNIGSPPGTFAYTFLN
jgi:fibronectin-binding autotransporter adhesin